MSTICSPADDASASSWNYPQVLEISARPWIWLAVLAAVASVAFYPGLNIPYFSDDFQYVGVAPDNDIFYFFTHRNPFHQFYRPVNSALLVTIQHYFGLSTWPQHLANTFIHVLMAWLVYLFMMRARFERHEALLGSTFMLLSQANAMAVLENDTFSQLAGTFFGYLTLWLLYKCFFEFGFERRERTRYIFFALALVAFALSLWSKETSISFAVLVGVFLLAKNYSWFRWPATIGKTLLEGLPFAAIAVVYLAIRARLGLPQATLGTAGRYQLWPGLNVIKNLLFDAFAAFVPVSSVQAFVAFQSRRVFLLVLIAVVVFAFVAIVVWGILKSPRRRLLTLFAVASVLALFPSFLLIHASELYLYNAMPLASVLVAVGLCRLLDAKRTKTFASALLLALFVSFILALHQKAHLMDQNGARAADILAQMKPYFLRVPYHGTLVLINPPCDRPSYSDYLVNGFDVFKTGENVLNEAAHRQDFSIEIVDSTGAPAANAGRLMLTLNGNELVPLDVSDSNQPRVVVGAKAKGVRR